MTSQDDIAVLRAMRERGEITDDEYTMLRRYVLWGTPLPPEMQDRYPGPPGYVHRSGPNHPAQFGPGPPVSRADRPQAPPTRPTDRSGDGRRRPGEPGGHTRPGEISGINPARTVHNAPPANHAPPANNAYAHPVGRAHPDSGGVADTGPRPLVPGRALERWTPAAPAALPARTAAQDRSGPAVPVLGPGAGRSRRPVAPGRRRRQVTVLVSAVLVLALVGTGVWWFALRVSPVQPDIYAHRVCTTVGGWQAAMAGAREQLVATMAGKDPPQAIRDKVVAFYQDAEERTAKLSVSMAGIGPPNVVGGASYAESLRQAVATTASSFHDDAERAGKLDTTSRAVFASQVQAEVASIDSRLQPMFDALSGGGLEPPLDLRAAFDSDPTCAAYTG